MLKRTFLFVLFFMSFFSENVFAEENTKYYLGESKMFSPEDVYYTSSVSIVKREVEKDKITETVISMNSKTTPMVYVTTFLLSGKDFLVKDDKLTFSGSGKVSGDEGTWDSWLYQVEMTGTKEIIKGSDKIIKDDIIVDKELFDSKGKIKVKFKEVLKPISKQVFEIFYNQILKRK